MVMMCDILAGFPEVNVGPTLYLFAQNETSCFTPIGIKTTCNITAIFILTVMIREDTAKTSCDNLIPGMAL
jgi:hypothetical protein